jgi:hypothetical protein
MTRWLLTIHGPDLQLTLPALPFDLLVIGPCACCGRSRASWMHGPRRVARVVVGQA